MPKLLVFYILCFALLGLIPAVDMVAGGGLMDFERLGMEASAETGIAWTSSLPDLVRLALVRPGLWLLVLGSAVPSLAALVAILAFPGRRRAMSDWLRSLAPIGTGRRPVALLLALLGVALACLAGVTTSSVLSGVGTLQSGGAAILLSLIPAAVLSGLLDQGALLEEGGWRGFAAPALEAWLTPVSAAAIVGVAWALWHVPRDILLGLPQEMGSARYLALYLPSFTLGTIAVSVIAGWGVLKSGGSLWPAILAHGLSNDAFGLAGEFSMDVALTPEHQLTKAVPLLAAAAILLAFFGKGMFSKSIS